MVSLNDPPLLSMESVSAGYVRRPVVFDVSMTVSSGEVVAVLGHNGAGKTTILKAAVGLLGAIGGRVRYRGTDVTGSGCAQRVKAGMSFTPAERFVFPDLTVEENLRLGALTEPSREVRRRQADRVYEIFPILRERSSQLAGTFSGGEQRMLSIGIALMSDPRLILLDEPSLGVSPAITRQVLAALRELVNADRRGVVLVEQNVEDALRTADRVYVMRSGRVILEESAEAMRTRDNWWDLF